MTFFTARDGRAQRGPGEGDHLESYHGDLSRAKTHVDVSLEPNKHPYDQLVHR
jgi:hypothetical protein